MRITAERSPLVASERLIVYVRAACIVLKADCLSADCEVPCFVNVCFVCLRAGRVGMRVLEPGWLGPVPV